jgi:zinc protease
MQFRPFITLFVALCIVTGAGCASKGNPGRIEAPVVTAASGVVETTLANGMKVIVKPDHRAPVVVSQIWYKVGSSYEHAGITGVSHVLEHMMFKGTRKHRSGEFSRIIAANGGSENAFTGRDYTAYFQQLEVSRLPISFELEADRMRNLTLPEDEFLKEVQVVMEERRLRTEDSPAALTYEQFMATAFQASAYHNPVIGWMNDLENLTVNDLIEWYRLWYAPNNATLVVVGDVIPAEVIAMADEYFGTIAVSDYRVQKPRIEPEQKGTRRIEVNVPDKLPIIIMGYKTPVLRTLADGDRWQAYALEVLAHVLDGGDSSRLSRDLIRGTEIAASAGAGYDLIARNDSLFTLEGVPTNGDGLDGIEAALRQQIETLQQELVSADELKRVKAQVTASKVYERDSIFYQAMQIGQLETVGIDWREGERYAEQIASVTAEQVRAVAQQFLTDERLTVARLNSRQHLATKAGGEAQ